MIPEEFRLADDHTRLCFIAELLGINEDIKRPKMYSWDFHGIRYESLSEAISAKVKIMNNTYHRLKDGMK